ncbi:hypothetical protein MRX96_040784 [Rhipicephalus microplus]
MSLWHTWVPNGKPMEAPYVPPSLATEDDKLSSTISNRYQPRQQKSLRAKYAKLTPVQKYAVNIALAGRDVMACAQTGSGKTASFGPLILYSLLSYTGPGKPPSCPVETLIAVIPSPACELAIQIMQDTQKYAYDSSRKTALVHERTSLQHQLAVLSRGCDILWLPTVFFYVVITFLPTCTKVRLRTPGEVNVMVAHISYAGSSFMFIVVMTWSSLMRNNSPPSNLWWWYFSAMCPQSGIPETYSAT